MTPSLVSRMWWNSIIALAVVHCMSSAQYCLNHSLGVLEEVALNKPSTQVSANMDGLDLTQTAALAVDGDTRTSHPLCSITAGGQDGSNLHWWLVNLLGIYLIHSVKIYNKDYRADRMRDLTIAASSCVDTRNYKTLDFDQFCAFYNGPASNNQVLNLNCASPVYGRYVTIWMMSYTGMALCEFKVFAQTVYPTVYTPGLDTIFGQKNLHYLSVASDENCIMMNEKPVPIIRYHWIGSSSEPRCSLGFLVKVVGRWNEMKQRVYVRSSVSSFNVNAPNSMDLEWEKCCFAGLTQMGTQLVYKAECFCHGDCYVDVAIVSVHGNKYDTTELCHVQFC